MIRMSLEEGVWREEFGVCPPSLKFRRRDEFGGRSFEEGVLSLEGGVGSLSSFTKVSAEGRVLRRRGENQERKDLPACLHLETSNVNRSKRRPLTTKN